MDDFNCPEWLTWMEAVEVARRWNWLRHTDDKPVPQFVLDEILRRDAAYQAAKEANRAT